MSLLTPEEAGERLRLAPRTIREMVRLGRLPAVLLGRLIRLREEDIRQIEETGMITGGPLTAQVASRFVSDQAEQFLDLFNRLDSANLATAFQAWADSKDFCAKDRVAIGDEVRRRLSATDPGGEGRQP
jgi:excisionase family DNA binding protein